MDKPKSYSERMMTASFSDRDDISGVDDHVQDVSTGNIAELRAELARTKDPEQRVALGQELQRILRFRKGVVPMSASQSDADLGLEPDEDLDIQPDAVAPPKMFVPSGEKPTPSLTDPDMIAGNPATRFALGAASPFLGVAQLGGHISDRLYELVGIPYRPGEAFSEYLSRVEKMKNSGRAKIGSEGIDFIEAIGSLFSPAALAALKIPVPMAAKIAGQAPKVAVKKFAAQSAGLGAAAGLTAPVTDGSENFAEKKAKQTLIGAAGGAAVPAAVIPATKLGQMIYRGAIEPWAAPAAIKGRAFLEAAGDKADDIIALLRNAEEIVPGSVPTAGQAAAPAGRAEFSALQRSAEGVRPSEYVARTDEQNAARLAQVRTVGKDAETLAAAESDRAATTGQLYKEAYDTLVKRDPELRQLWKNPYFKESVGDAFKLLKANDQLPLRNNMTQFLHYVKEGLDAKIQSANKPNAPSISRAELRTMQNVKKQLVDWMGAKNPAYEEARSTFAEMSEPINQMKVGQYLEDKLVPAVSEEAKQSATQYSNALRDAPGTIRKAAGGPRFDELAKVLEPEQLRAVESVREDLARGARYELLAKQGSKAGPNALDLATQSAQEAAGGKIPNILDRTAMVANAILSRLQGKMNKKLAAEIAVEMLHPQQVGESLAKAKARAVFNARVVSDVQKVLRDGTMLTAHDSARESAKAKGAK